MNDPISRVAFTAAVKAAQEERGSRASYARMEQRGDPGSWRDIVPPELPEFIEERDSLYLGTASADGQPYIQYRGGQVDIEKENLRERERESASRSRCSTLRQRSLAASLGVGPSSQGGQTYS